MSIELENLPKPGTLWIYKGDPARLYEVIYITNIAVRNENHPPQVVYRTCRKPEHIWSRSVANFHSVFTAKTD